MLYMHPIWFFKLIYIVVTSILYLLLCTFNPTLWFQIPILVGSTTAVAGALRILFCRVRRSQLLSCRELLGTSSAISASVNSIAPRLPMAMWGMGGLGVVGGGWGVKMYKDVRICWNVDVFFEVAGFSTRLRGEA